MSKPMKPWKQKSSVRKPLRRAAAFIKIVGVPPQGKVLPFWLAHLRGRRLMRELQKVANA